MTSYYVEPPRRKSRGKCADTFIVSTLGLGYVRKDGTKEFRLLSIRYRRDKETNAQIFSLVFERGKKKYECSQDFPIRKGRPTVRMDGRMIRAPEALWPFAHPETKIIQV